MLIIARIKFRSCQQEYRDKDFFKLTDMAHKALFTEFAFGQFKKELKQAAEKEDGIAFYNDCYTHEITITDKSSECKVRIDIGYAEAEKTCIYDEINHTWLEADTEETESTLNE